MYVSSSSPLPQNQNMPLPADEVSAMFAQFRRDADTFSRGRAELACMRVGALPASWASLGPSVVQDVAAGQASMAANRVPGSVAPAATGGSGGVGNSGGGRAGGGAGGIVASGDSGRWAGSRRADPISTPLHGVGEGGCNRSALPQGGRPVALPVRRIAIPSAPLQVQTDIGPAFVTAPPVPSAPAAPLVSVPPSWSVQSGAIVPPQQVTFNEENMGPQAGMAPNLALVPQGTLYAGISGYSAPWGDTPVPMSGTPGSNSGGLVDVIRANPWAALLVGAGVVFFVSRL